MGADAKEGGDALLEKRKPSWRCARRSASRSPDRYVVDAEGGEERDVGGGAEAEDDRLAGEAEETASGAFTVAAPEHRPGARRALFTDTVSDAGRSLLRRSST